MFFRKGPSNEELVRAMSQAELVSILHDPDAWLHPLIWAVLVELDIRGRVE